MRLAKALFPTHFMIVFNSDMRMLKLTLVAKHDLERSSYTPIRGMHSCVDPITLFLIAHQSPLEFAHSCAKVRAPCEKENEQRKPIGQVLYHEYPRKLLQPQTR